MAQVFLNGCFTPLVLFSCQIRNLELKVKMKLKLKGILLLEINWIHRKLRLPITFSWNRLYYKINTFSRKKVNCTKQQLLLFSADVNKASQSNDEKSSLEGHAGGKKQKRFPLLWTDLFLFQVLRTIFFFVSRRALLSRGWKPPMYSSACQSYDYCPMAG